eukprot:COSAG06_NODE_7238_length_2576_cov_2.112636_2_plen_76_part_01
MYSFMYLFVTQVLRRPTPNREANIGVWQEILTCLVYLSVSSLAAALHLHLHLHSTCRSPTLLRLNAVCCLLSSLFC